MSNDPPPLPTASGHGRSVRFWLSVAAGFVAVMLVMTTCHQLGYINPAKQPGYPYSEAIMRCVSPGFLLSYVSVGILLGGGLRRPQAVAVGMMLPLPLAALIEMLQDRTSHNLIPFEIVLYWTPAFLLALLSAWVGKKLRNLKPKG